MRDYQIRTISTFSVLFAQAIGNQQQRIKGSQQTVLLSAHEMATPLQMIWDNITYIREVMRQRLGPVAELDSVFDDTEDVIEHTAFVNRSAKAIVAGALTWVPQPVSIYDDICMPIFKMLRRRAKCDNKTIKYYGEFQEIPVLYVDKIRLQRVFHNLLSNALKYSFKNTDIWIIVKPSDGWIISVADTGIPIPENCADRVFEEGFRTEEAKEKDFSGTGMGLFFCRQIVERLGGWIRVTGLSDPVVVSFHLPRTLTT